MIDPMQFWTNMPQDVKSFFISIAANLATQFLPSGKRASSVFEERMSLAYEEGFRQFGAHFGNNCYYNLKDLLCDEEALGYLVVVIRDDSALQNPVVMERAIFRAGIETKTIQDFSLEAAVQSFVTGFRAKAENSAEGLQILAYFQQMRASLIHEEILFVLQGMRDEPKDVLPDLNALQLRYFNYLAEKYSRLEFRGMSDKMLPIPIENLYTRLTFSRELHEDRSAYLRSKERVQLADISRLFKTENSATFTEIMGSPFTVITGDPGAGKSTLLKYIAVAFAEGKFKQRLGLETGLLPIIFPVSAFAEMLRKPTPPGFALEDFLICHFREKSLPDLMPLFRNAGRNGHALYLIDGLDEVSDETERRKMVQCIRDFIINNSHEGNRYIVTCRTASYTKATRFESINNKKFSHFSVHPFDLDQIKKFLLNWYRFYHREVLQRTISFEDEARQSLEAMMRVVQGEPNIQIIATNPLMLTILALIEHEGGRLPENRADLYQKCLSMMAGAWENIRSLHVTEDRNFRLGGRKISEDFIVAYLGPIAKYLHEESLTKIDHGDLKRQLAEAFDTRNKDIVLSREQAEDFIEILRQQSGILQKAAPGIYGFSHKTFKEYLTARMLTDISENPISELEGHLFTPEWKEVILLAAATFKKRAATGFIDAILKKDAPQFENLILAGECVADIGRDRIFDDLYDTLILKVREVAFEGSEASLRASVAEIMGRLGDPRSDLKEFVSIPGEKFEIGKYPVTNAWFGEFIEAGGYENYEYWTPEGGKWLAETNNRKPMYWHKRKWNTPNAPVVGVCWYEAAAFCQWLTPKGDKIDYQLPSDRQWEIAAAGREGREHPWGPWEEGRCNTDESKIGRTTSVGIFTNGCTPEGVYDMAGNVWEWTQSDYHSEQTRDDFHFDAKLQKVWDDYLQVDETDAKEKLQTTIIKAWEEKDRQLPTLRGGSWGNGRLFARCAARYRGSPLARFNLIGFRCVRTSKK